MRFGGGGNMPKRAPSKASAGGLRKWDSSGLCPFPLRKAQRFAMRIAGRESIRRKNWEMAKGAANLSCDLGGGGKHAEKGPLQSQCWRPQKVGFVWSVPGSPKEDDDS